MLDASSNQKGVNKMRTIRTKVYQFNELSKEAQKTAINEIREKYYNYNDFDDWAIDNCYLLEPKHDELINLFGKNFYDVVNENNKYKDNPLIKNNRKVEFSLDRNRYIDISNAMEIQNSNYFLRWLGLNNRLIAKVDYTILADSIEFYSQSEFTKIEQAKLENAVYKFENHCQDILNRIESDIDYYFSDESIIEDIEANDYEFLIDGKRFK